MCEIDKFKELVYFFCDVIVDNVILNIYSVVKIRFVLIIVFKEKNMFKLSKGSNF